MVKVTGASAIKSKALSAARARLARRLAGDRSGAVALEFAIVAIPLLLMLFAIIELGLVFMVSSTLENATSNVARTIRTGEQQKSGGGNANGIRNTICSELGWLQNQCQTNLSVDVRTFPQFKDPAIPSPVAGGNFDNSKLAYDEGDPGDIVLVRAFYRWKLVTPFFLNGALARLNNGTAMITAASTFRNEPYGS